MVYIIGANHRFQFINSQTDLIESEQFRNYILKHVENNHIECLAEEMNDEWLAKWNTNRCICREIAEEIGITHVMCDANTEERKGIGYKTTQEIIDENGLSPLDTSKIEAIDRMQWRKREEFWLSKIEPHLNKNILFVCGPDHVVSFSELLKEKGIEVEVICKRYEAN